MSNEPQKHRIVATSLNVTQMIELEIFPLPKQQIITTTSDHLKICLTENLRKAEKKHDWLAPFGIIVADVTTFVTAEFKDLWLPAKTWEAIFIILGLASIVWFFGTLKNAFYKIDVDQIIEKIKNDQKPFTYSMVNPTFNQESSSSPST